MFFVGVVAGGYDIGGWFLCEMGDEGGGNEVGIGI